jgi:hypothetical protein
VENEDHASFEALVTANAEAITDSKSKLNAMLMQAIALGSLRAFKVLLSRGAEFKITAENDDVLLRAAVLSDRPNIEMVRLLLQHRANAALSKSKTVDWALLDQSEVNAAKIVPFLLGGNVSDGHKLYWAAATLAEYVPCGFSTGDDIHVRRWDESMMPLWKSMPNVPAARSHAIAQAVQQLASYPHAGARIAFIQKSAWFLYSSMDQKIDFHPIANAMLDADCFFCWTNGLSHST